MGCKPHLPDRGPFSAAFWAGNESFGQGRRGQPTFFSKQPPSGTLLHWTECGQLGEDAFTMGESPFFGGLGLTWWLAPLVSYGRFCLSTIIIPSMSNSIRSPQTVCKHLMKSIPKEERKDAVKKTICFSNEDVPAFLKKLTAFETRSAKKDYALR